jgi:hypothetical protein
MAPKMLLFKCRVFHQIVYSGNAVPIIFPDEPFAVIDVLIDDVFLVVDVKVPVTLYPYYGVGG